jgi:hypothetical protein
MRKFLITSPKFTGIAELIYNAEGTLIVIDCSKTNIDVMRMDHFKRAIPVSLAGLLNNHSFSPDTVIHEADLVISFEEFWQNYPLKRNRYKVEQIWKKMSGTDQVKAFYNLQHYKKYLSRNSWLTPMMGDRYLRNKEFETEWMKIYE